MLLPYGDTNIPGGRTPVVTYALIAINVVVFLRQVALPRAALEEFVYAYGFVPAAGLGGLTALTSMFLHGGWVHLGGNMLFLFLFGDNIEQTVGRLRYALFYLSGGLVATAAHYFSAPGSLVPAIGASGAIAAVMGAYIVCFPHAQIKMLWLFFPFRISAFLFLGVWILQQVLSGSASLGIPTEDTAGVAWWAHVGGFAFGVGCGLSFRSMRKRGVEPPELPGSGGAWVPRRV